MVLVFLILYVWLCVSFCSNLCYENFWVDDNVYYNIWLGKLKFKGILRFWFYRNYLCWIRVSYLIWMWENGLKFYTRMFFVWFYNIFKVINLMLVKFVWEVLIVIYKMKIIVLDFDNKICDIYGIYYI